MARGALQCSEYNGVQSTSQDVGHASAGGGVGFKMLGKVAPALDAPMQATSLSTVLLSCQIVPQSDALYP